MDALRLALFPPLSLSYVALTTTGCILTTATKGDLDVVVGHGIKVAEVVVVVVVAVRMDNAEHECQSCHRYQLQRHQRSKRCMPATEISLTEISSRRSVANVTLNGTAVDEIVSR
eukprot:jgi/Phyca11/14692/fgenesh1_pg.PHYCAscaffold_9_\